MMHSVSTAQKMDHKMYYSMNNLLPYQPLEIKIKPVKSETPVPRRVYNRENILEPSADDVAFHSLDLGSSACENTIPTITSIREINSNDSFLFNSGWIDVNVEEEEEEMNRINQVGDWYAAHTPEEILLDGSIPQSPAFFIGNEALETYFDLCYNSRKNTEDT